MWTENVGLNLNSNAQGHQGNYSFSQSISTQNIDNLFLDGITAFEGKPSGNSSSGFSFDMAFANHVGWPEQPWGSMDKSLNAISLESRLNWNESDGSSDHYSVQFTPDSSTHYRVEAQLSTRNDGAALLSTPEYFFTHNLSHIAGRQAEFRHSSEKIARSSVISEPHQPEAGTSPISSSGSHRCPDCNRVCNNEKSLRGHMRSHDRRHACKTAGCDQRFTTTRDLKRHHKSVHIRTGLKCPKCPAQFRGGRADNLRRHTKTRH